MLYCTLFLRFILRCKQAAIFDQYFSLMSVYGNLLLSALYFSSGTCIGQMEYEIAMNRDVFMLSCFVTYPTNVITVWLQLERENNGDEKVESDCLQDCITRQLLRHSVISPDNRKS